jgi:hypothetical protein
MRQVKVLVFEPIYMARGDEIFIFDGIDMGVFLVVERCCEPKKGIDDENHPMGNLVHIEPLKCLHRIER